jgi:Fe-S cluster assembly protein SufD
MRPEAAMTVIKAETAPYLEAFRATAGKGSEPRWLTTRRQTALARFAELGFPTRRDEAWRFNDLRALQRTPFPPAPSGVPMAADAIEDYRAPGATHRMVFVNGHFAPDLSDIGVLPDGVWLASTARTIAEHPELLQEGLDETDLIGGQAFASLNAALFADGIVLALAPGVVLEHPVEVIHLGQAAAPQSVHLRNAVLLGRGSRATLIESFAGQGVYWTNAVTLVQAGEGAVLHHVKLQDEGREAIHFAVVRARLDREARYDSFVLTLGGRLSRHDTLTAMMGDAATCALNGAYLLRGEQEATNATFVDHAAPGGSTQEVFKGVVDERAHGVFLGKIAVRPDAQKTDARQLNRNLLLSPRAAVDTKPELEILADDVKCSHGATVGDLDESAVFYLRTRGIPLVEARRMLIEAFAADALETVEDAVLRAHLGRHVQRWLAKPGE